SSGSEVQASSDLGCTGMARATRQKTAENAARRARCPASMSGAEGYTLSQSLSPEAGPARPSRRRAESEAAQTPTSVRPNPSQPFRYQPAAIAAPAAPQTIMMSQFWRKATGPESNPLTEAPEPGAFCGHPIRP